MLRYGKAYNNSIPTSFVAMAVRQLFPQSLWERYTLTNHADTLTWIDTNFLPRDCEWTITVDPGNQILLNVTEFELEHHSNCNYDYLEIRLLCLNCGDRKRILNHLQKWRLFIFSFDRTILWQRNSSHNPFVQ